MIVIVIVSINRNTTTTTTTTNNNNHNTNDNNTSSAGGRRSPFRSRSNRSCSECFVYADLAHGGQYPLRRRGFLVPGVNLLLTTCYCGGLPQMGATSCSGCCLLLIDPTLSTPISSVWMRRRHVISPFCS